MSEAADIPKNTDAEIQRYIQQLTHSEMTLRSVARKELKRLGTPAITALLEELETEFRKYHARERQLKRVSKMGILVCALMMISSLIRIGLGSPSTFLRLLVLMSFAHLFACGVLYSFGSALPERLKTLYGVLVEMDDPRIFSVLLEMYHINPGWSVDDMLNLLTAYLPQTTAAHWEKLSKEQRKVLNRLIESRGQINTVRCYEFTLAALKALEQYGDAEALPAVQHIAKHGSNEKLRQAAQECLPYLEMRRDEQSTRQTLLRASQSNNGKEELLRAPAQAANTQQEQLLRIPQEGE